MRCKCGSAKVGGSRQKLVVHHFGKALQRWGGPVFPEKKPFVLKVSGIEPVHYTACYLWLNIYTNDNIGDRLC